MQLVRRHGEQVDPELIDACRDLSGGLHGVGVEVGAASLARDRDQLADRLDGADLVVRVHDADQDRVGPERPAQVGGIDQPGAIDGEPRHFEAGLLERVRRTQHRIVLDRGRNHVPSLVGIPLRDPLEREVVALRSARCEDDFLGRHPVISGDLVARLVDCLARALTEPINTRGVAELVGEVRHHRLEHLGIEWCRR